MVFYTVLFMLFAHALLLDAFQSVDARYPCWAINHTANFSGLVLALTIALLILLSLLYYFTRPHVRMAFQHDDEIYSHPIITWFGWAVTGASTIGLAWGVVPDL